MDIVGFIIIIVIIRELINYLIELTYRLNTDTFTMFGTVIAKRTETDPFAIYSNNIITFALENGNRAAFKVTYYNFDYYIKGDKGKLTYKGNKFINFEFE